VFDGHGKSVCLESVSMSVSLLLCLDGRNYDIPFLRRLNFGITLNFIASAYCDLSITKMLIVPRAKAPSSWWFRETCIWCFPALFSKDTPAWILQAALATLEVLFTGECAFTFASSVQFSSLSCCRSPNQSLFFTRLTQLIAALVILAPLESCLVLLHFSLTSAFQTTTTA
jgi:hypothetical protein